MKKYKLRLLIIVAVLLITISLVVAAVFYTLNSTNALTRILSYLIEHNIEDIQIIRFSIKDHAYTFPDNFELKNIKVVFNYQNEKYSFNSDSLSAYGLMGLIDSRRGSSFLIKEGSLSSHIMKIKGIDVFLNMQRDQWIQGSVKVGLLKFKDLEFQTISSRLLGDPEFIQFLNIRGKGYDGSYQGEIMVDLLPEIFYSITMKIDRLNPKDLEPIYPNIFSNIKGFINGLLNIKSQGAVANINAELSLPEGGTVRAVLLKPLLEHIPQSTQKVELERLIQENGDVRLSLAECDILTLEKEKMTAHFVLLSKEFNFDIDLIVDLNVEGGIDQLFKYFLIFD